jgi:hypothetical protein
LAYINVLILIQIMLPHLEQMKLEQAASAAPAAAT